MTKHAMTKHDLRGVVCLDQIELDVSPADSPPLSRMRTRRPDGSIAENLGRYQPSWDSAYSEAQAGEQWQQPRALRWTAAGTMAHRDGPLEGVQGSPAPNSQITECLNVPGITTSSVMARPQVAVLPLGLRWQ